MTMKSSLTTEESLLVQLMTRIGLQDITPHVLFANRAIEAFTDTGLSPETLSAIWDIADRNAKGYLVKEEILIAIRLVGWAQAGEAPITADLAHKCESCSSDSILKL
jgi:hypothetical protein